jgi:hypothetical protein
MRNNSPVFSLATIGAVLAASLLTLNDLNDARADSIPNGQARAVQATVFGTTTNLADTGTLEDFVDFQENSLSTGSVSSLLTANVLHAATTAGGDQVDSGAALFDLDVAVGVITVSADFAMSQARAVDGAGSGGTSEIHELYINGLLTLVTGQVNQVIPLVGGEVVINEHLNAPGGVTVNALRITVDGVADIVIASSTAGLP